MVANTEIKENKKSTSFFKRLLQIDEIGVLGSFVLICVLLAVSTEHFGEVGNILAVIRQASYYGMMAVGMVFVIAQGDIDLSVGSLYNLVTMTLAFACQNGMPVNFVIPLGLLMGGLFGFVNGALSILLKIPMIIVTLGTTTIYGGLSLVVGAGSSLSKFPKDNWFFDTFSGKLFGVVPASVVMLAVLAIIGYILFNHTTYGRYTCAIGANKQAAKFAGINIELYRLITMTFSGVCAGIAGIGIFGFLKAADPSVGKGSEMMAISAAIIGGASLVAVLGVLLVPFWVL